MGSHRKPLRREWCDLASIQEPHSSCSAENRGGWDERRTSVELTSEQTGAGMTLSSEASRTIKAHSGTAVDTVPAMGRGCRHMKWHFWGSFGQGSPVSWPVNLEEIIGRFIMPLPEGIMVLPSDSLLKVRYCWGPSKLVVLTVMEKLEQRGQWMASKAALHGSAQWWVINRWRKMLTPEQTGDINHQQYCLYNFQGPMQINRNTVLLIQT